MAFFDKISKTVYTDAIQNIGWQPYTRFRGDRCYFNYKGDKVIPIENETDLIRCYEKNGIKIRPISDLIDNVYIKDLIEISSTDYILNNKYCHSRSKISSLTFNRLAAFLGISTSRFATIKAETNKTDREVLQFLLKTYKKNSGIGAELKKNNIPRELYYYRLRMGWDKEKAKTTPVRKIGKVYDHKGNEFSNQKEMLRHYGISQSHFSWRKNKGFSLEQCLAPTKQKRIVKKIGITYDHEGNEFSNQKEMLKHYGISQSQFFRRKKKGFSLEECLAPTKQKFNSSSRVARDKKDKL